MGGDSPQLWMLHFMTDGRGWLPEKTTPDRRDIRPTKDTEGNAAPTRLEGHRLLNLGCAGITETRVNLARSRISATPHIIREGKTA